jgi:hypothetical protein
MLPRQNALYDRNDSAMLFALLGCSRSIAMGRGNILEDPADVFVAQNLEIAQCQQE